LKLEGAEATGLVW